MPTTDSHWETYGRLDPYYGVITNPKFRKVASDGAIREEFFSTGEAHVADVMSTIHRHLEPEFHPTRALDFGCGVGRLTIPLARRAREVVGIDVSESMLAEAQRNCDRVGASNVRLVKSDDELSKLTDSFDLLHSHIVFQHIPPARGVAMLAAMLPRLAEGGIGVLHFTYWIPPPPRTNPVRRAYLAARGTLPFLEPLANVFRGRPADHPRMEMNGYDLNALLRMLQTHDCHRVHVRFTDHAGPCGVVLFFRRERLPSM